jgi:DNA-binding transcriptional ArsR family regulator
MDDNLDNVWKALADPTRRAVLDMLRLGPRTTGDLAGAFPGLTRYAVMKHLGVLEAAGLLVVRRDGRKRWNHLNAVPLRRVYERWVSRYEDAWAGSLVRLKQAVEVSERLKEQDVAETGTQSGTQSGRVVVIEQRVEIAASTSAVYEAITKHIGRWFWSGEKGELSPVAIEEHAGGRFFREEPDGSCDLYGIVTAIRPGKLIRIEGSIGGKYATMSIFCFKIEPHGDGSIVNLTHRMAGEVMEAEVADYDEGWRDELGSLKRFAEAGKGRLDA